MARNITWNLILNAMKFTCWQLHKCVWPFHHISSLVLFNEVTFVNKICFLLFARLIFVNQKAYTSVMELKKKVRKSKIKWQKEDFWQKCTKWMTGKSPSWIFCILELLIDWLSWWNPNIWITSSVPSSTVTVVKHGSISAIYRRRKKITEEEYI